MKQAENIKSDITVPALLEMNTVISCVLCGRTHNVQMPKYATQNVFNCPDCGYETKASSAECCVYCEYGKTPCPPQQRRTLYFKLKNK